MKVAKRVVAALSAAAAVVVLILALDRWGGQMAFGVVAAAMTALALLAQAEFYKMVSARYSPLAFAGLFAGFVYLVGLFFLDCSFIVPIVFGLSLATLFSKADKPVGQLAVTLFGFFYIPWMFAHFIRVPQMHGMMALLYVVAIVKASDMGGFAIGLLLGRHRLCPSISPKKTWEGLVGSVVGACVVSAAFIPITGYSAQKALAFGVCAALAGTLGDLVESRIKRECGVKDSSCLMPAGMGGFLDMLDSLVFAPALMQPYL